MKRKYLTIAEKEFLVKQFKGVTYSEQENFLKVWSNSYNISLVSLRKFLKEKKLYLINKVDWTAEEEKVLRDFCELVPIEVIVKKIQAVNRKHNKKLRSREAIEAKLLRMGLSANCQGEYYSASEMATLLNMSVATLCRWIVKDAKVRRILKPVENTQEKYRIHRKNIAKFCVEYRSEISNYKVDLVWLLSLFTN